MGLLPPPPYADITRGFNGTVVHAASVDLVDQLTSLIFDYTSKTAKTVVAFAQAVGRGVEGIKPELADVHRQLALEAQNAIVEAYVDSLKGTPTYRVDPKHERNKRYAGGVLESVLRSADFCASDSNGVYIGNIEKLDSAARQWGRLNYGAGGAAGGGARSFVVRWSDLDSFVLEEPGSARPGFTLPAGRWIGAAFYPYSELPDQEPGGAVGQRHKTGSQARSAGGQFASGRRTAIPTRGIKGQHWLGAGLQVVAENLGPAYTNLFQRLWDEASATTRAALAGDSGLSRPGRPVSSVS